MLYPRRFDIVAVALPQYQVAVGKTRVMRLLPLITAISHAQDVYFLANGEYSTRLDVLDIDLPAGGELAADGKVVVYNNFVCLIGGVGNSVYCNSSIAGDPKLEKYNGSNFVNCWCGSSALAEKICKSISGKTNPDGISGDADLGKVYSF